MALKYTNRKIMGEVQCKGEEEEIFSMVRDVCVKREKTLCEGGKKEKGDNSRQPFEINLDPRLIGCVWVCLDGWILNLRQELQDGGGEQRPDGQSDEIDE